MKITRFDVITINIPMRLSVRHALAERSEARNILVVAHDEAGHRGWGECCPRPYVTGETVDSVKKDLRQRILPRFLGRELEDFEQAGAALSGVLVEVARNQQAAFCACELSLLDLAGQVFDKSAGSVLGPVVSREVNYSGVIASESVETVKKYAAMMRELRITDVKVKVGGSLEGNLKLLELARSILGEKVNLRIDANCAWSGEEAVRQLRAMKEFRLVGVEQPVAGDDLEGLKQVTGADLVPVAADESLCSMEDAETLIREHACHVFNVRISKCGGLINAGRIYRRARQAGLDCQLGAQVGETGFLSAAGRHFATRSEGVLWYEGSYGNLLLEQDITQPDITVGARGAGPALETPGLGVAPVMERLEACKTDVFSVD